MNLITAGIAIIILPSILIILMPLIDRIITIELIENINGVIDYIEYFIGSTNTNLLFGIIGLLILMPFIRWFFKFFGTNE